MNRIENELVAMTIRAEQQRAEIERLRAALQKTNEEVDRMWALVPKGPPAPALRSLHAAVEGDKPPIFQHPAALRTATAEEKRALALEAISAATDLLALKDAMLKLELSIHEEIAASRGEPAEAGDG